jgi:hypothetical protein
MESFTSCGRLEPLRAAEAAEWKRGDTQLMRGVRNAAHTRLDGIRNAIVDFQTINQTDPGRNRLFICVMTGSVT